MPFTMKAYLNFTIVFLLVFTSQLFAEESQLASKATESLLLDIEKLPNGRLVTVGERGHVLFSDDQGNSWTQVVVPTNKTLTAVDFVDQHNGVAVGYDQTILQTSDGGNSWQLKYQSDAIDLPALFDVLMNSEQHIVAVGAFGLYLESKDGGESWDPLEKDGLADNYGGFSHLYSLVSLSQQHWIVAGEKYVAGENDDGEEISTALLAETHDAGKTWQKIATPYDGSFFGAKVSKNKEIYIYGLRGNVFISRDQGKSWRSLFLSTASGIHDMAFLPNGDWVLVGTGGVLAQKGTGGSKISKRKDLKGRAALVAIDDNTLIVVGEGGVERVALDDK